MPLDPPPVMDCSLAQLAYRDSALTAQIEWRQQWRRRAGQGATTTEVGKGSEGGQQQR
uniref:Uncharacterized protein n=2 Tax=Anguilla anguilla TaxID=7936 RepID=A0A0E9S3D1_ANGAN